MSEVNISCNIFQHRNKEKENSEKIVYTDNLAEYFAKVNGTKPRPKLHKGEIDERGFWIRQRNYLTTPFGKKEGELKADKNALEELNIEPKLIKTFGGSDNNNLNKYGIEGIVVANAMNNVHTVKEYFDINDLIKSINIAIKLITIK